MILKNLQNLFKGFLRYPLKKISIFSTIFIIITPIFTFAAETETVDSLQKFIDNTKTLQANFSQIVINDQNIEVERSNGHLSIQRPNQFRWEYIKPYRQLIVADGYKIWFFDEDIEQVTVKQQDKAIDHTPATFLSGSTQWKKDFILQKHEKISEHKQKFVLLPKNNDSNFAKIELIFSSNDELSNMILMDKAQQTTHINFSQVQINPSLDAELFRFSPPSGIDVIGDQ